MFKAVTEITDGFPDIDKGLFIPLWARINCRDIE